VEVDKHDTGHDPPQSPLKKGTLMHSLGSPLGKGAAIAGDHTMALNMYLLSAFLRLSPPGVIQAGKMPALPINSRCNSCQPPRHGMQAKAALGEADLSRKKDDRARQSS
jgi:hypothetical protein